MSSFSLGIVTTNYGLGPKFFSIVSFHDRFHPQKERLFCNETLKSAYHYVQLDLMMCWKRF